MLKIEGGPFFPLTSFGGCFDKVLVVEYEDCHFATGVLSPDLLQWLEDTVEGGVDLVRDVTLSQIDEVAFVESSRTEIGGAFLRDFAISDFDAAGRAGTLSFVLVPGTLQTNPGSGAPVVSTNGPTFAASAFTFVAAGIDGSRVAAVRGLHMSVPKLPLPPAGSRRRFQPGTPQFDDVALDAAFGGTTFADLELWASEVAAGIIQPRSAEVEIRTAGGSLIAEVLLEDLVPIAFPGFQTARNRRTMLLDVGSFTIQ